MTVAVVDSGGANIASVLHALRRLGVEPVFTGDRAQIRTADHVILPGVGSADAAMKKLRQDSLADLIPDLSQPVLGVCLGMQLLFDYSEEGETPMLGIIPGTVRRFPGNAGLRVPHMGWNSCCTVQNINYTSDIYDNWFYFVHSFYAPVSDATVATADHGLRFSAVVQYKNFLGVQFHPERSAQAGSDLLKRFLQGKN